MTDDRVLDPAIVERFRRDGFVVVDDVFTDAEMDAMTAAVAAAVEADMREDTRALAEKSRYEQSFQQCLYLWARYPDVAPWTAHPRLAATAAALLGAERVRIWHDQALFKEPGGRPTDPHQDHPYWPIAEPDQVTAWIPLDGSTSEAGAMSYWPGSHRLGLDLFVNIFGDTDPDDIGHHPALDGVDAVTLEVPRGSVAFHHGLTAHRASGNSTGRTRRVHTVIFTADGVHRKEGLGHPSVDIDGIAPGEPIAGDLTPVVWPAPPAPPVAPPTVVAQLEQARRARLAQRLGK
ncbi:phytanoyl-CoA dioxygenase family protein [Desertimonas flava]|uniref:phytanoyl-CoA dioxygenase family protein n=1 Tax=Desertimonas flava TaxID=2064846 RepID=UPI0013C49379|nr:phytanoyl-CoA dioxygenase family protein [Desertimonas flava]